MAPASGTTPQSRAKAKAAGEPTTYTARKNAGLVSGKSPDAPVVATQSIADQASQIQAGLSKLSEAQGKGLSVTPETSVQDAEAFMGKQATPLAQATQASPQAPQSMIGQVNMASKQVSDLSTQYKQGLSMAQQTGVASPSGAGAASAGVGQFMGQVTPPPESPSLIGEVMDTDSNFDSILTSYDDYFSPPKQKQSLLQEYQSMSKSLGIGAMNEELIDAKRIIDGTEDDIRSEITAAGGLATESQVMALGNARNKSLIKNYNYLLESRDSAMTQLNTMMNLSVQDRQMAEAEFDRKLNFTFKVQEFKERATTNARNTYMTLGEKMGWDTLISSVSPYEKSVMQKTLGISDTAMSSLAFRSQQDRANSTTQTGLEQDLLRAQINKTKAETGVGTGTGLTNTTPDERRNEVLTLAQDLRKSDAVGKKSAVGASFAKLLPGAKYLGLQPSRSAFETRVNTLKSNLTLDNLKLLKGAMSDKDLLFLNSIGSSLDTDMSEAEFDVELDKVITKLGGVSGGTITVAPDGTEVIIVD